MLGGSGCSGAAGRDRAEASGLRLHCGSHMTCHHMTAQGTPPPQVPCPLPAFCRPGCPLVSVASVWTVTPWGPPPSPLCSSLSRAAQRAAGTINSLPSRSWLCWGPGRFPTTGPAAWLSGAWASSRASPNPASASDRLVLLGPVACPLWIPLPPFVQGQQGWRSAGLQEINCRIAV